MTPLAFFAASILILHSLLERSQAFTLPQSSYTTRDSTLANNMTCYRGFRKSVEGIQTGSHQSVVQCESRQVCLDLRADIIIYEPTGTIDKHLGYWGQCIDALMCSMECEVLMGMITESPTNHRFDADNCRFSCCSGYLCNGEVEPLQENTILTPLSGNIRCQVGTRSVMPGVGIVYDDSFPSLCSQGISTCGWYTYTLSVVDNNSEYYVHSQYGQCVRSSVEMGCSHLLPFISDFGNVTSCRSNVCLSNSSEKACNAFENNYPPLPCPKPETDRDVKIFPNCTLRQSAAASLSCIAGALNGYPYRSRDTCRETWDKTISCLSMNMEICLRSHCPTALDAIPGFRSEFPAANFYASQIKNLESLLKAAGDLGISGMSMIEDVICPGRIQSVEQEMIQLVLTQLVNSIDFDEIINEYAFNCPDVFASLSRAAMQFLSEFHRTANSPDIRTVFGNLKQSIASANSVCDLSRFVNQLLQLAGDVGVQIPEKVITDVMELVVNAIPSANMAEEVEAAETDNSEGKPRKARRMNIPDEMFCSSGLRAGAPFNLRQQITETCRMSSAIQDLNVHPVCLTVLVEATTLYATSSVYMEYSMCADSSLCSWSCEQFYDLLHPSVEKIGLKFKECSTQCCDARGLCVQHESGLSGRVIDMSQTNAGSNIDTAVEKLILQSEDFGFLPGCTIKELLRKTWLCTTLFFNQYPYLEETLCRENMQAYSRCTKQTFLECLDGTQPNIFNIAGPGMEEMIIQAAMEVTNWTSLIQNSDQLCTRAATVDVPDEGSANVLINGGLNDVCKTSNERKLWDDYGQLFNQIIRANNSAEFCQSYESYIDWMQDLVAACNVGEVLPISTSMPGLTTAISTIVMVATDVVLHEFKFPQCTALKTSEEDTNGLLSAGESL